MAKLPEIEAEAAVEQDDGDGELDDRLLQGAEIAFRIDDAEHRPGDEAGQEHQRDCRPAGAPRDPLRADAEDAAQRDLHHQRVDETHPASMPRWSANETATAISATALYVIVSCGPRNQCTQHARQL